MRLRFPMAMCLASALLLTPSRVHADDAVQAKAFLKDYLKEVGNKYSFPEWEKRLIVVRAKVDRLRSQASQSGKAIDASVYADLDPISRDVEELLSRRADTDKLIRELYVATVVAHIDGRFKQAGKPWDPDAKLAFQRSLMPYEGGSLRPKTSFQNSVSALDRDFRAAQTGLLFAYAQDFLGRRVEEHLRSHDFAKMEAMYDDYSLQLDYWTRELQANPVQTDNQLANLSRKFDMDKIKLRENLSGLLEVLNTDMLFSDLLEYARKQKVEFSLEVEEKIEASLKERSEATLAPIEQRLGLWKSFAANLREKCTMAHQLAESQQSQALAQAEDTRKEQERLEALKAEQRKSEEEQKEKFSQTLSALKTFTFKGETSVELDDDSKKALSTQAGFLKTSYVRSGVNKLKVDKQKFSDTLALVQKFTVQEGSVDFSKMSLQERSNQSAYTFASPGGRTCQDDLKNFVSQVALGSFSTYYNFLSYVTPSRWSPGRGFNWAADRDGEKAVQDREFSYVDLVVDAHRKRSNVSSRGESTMNLPANMIVIFDPNGAILRFQSFGDISQVSIRSGDLSGGKLYYKFLNYSTDRQNIYLNGIDSEMKIGSPSSKG